MKHSLLRALYSWHKEKGHNSILATHVAVNNYSDSYVIMYMVYVHTYM